MSQQNTWNIEFHEISIFIKDKLIQVKNDDKLVKFLLQPGNGSLELAKHLRKLYKEQLAKDIKITEKSLAIEILGHVFTEQVCDALSHIPLKEVKYFFESIKEHTSIIDCGEKSIDHNRHCI